MCVKSLININDVFTIFVYFIVISKWEHSRSSV